MIYEIKNSEGSKLGFINLWKVGISSESKIRIDFEKTIQNLSESDIESATTQIKELLLSKKQEG